MDISTITETQALQFATDARQEMLDGARQMNDFLFDMGKRVADGKPMSDRQVDALRKFVVREQEFAARKQAQAAADANAEDCPTGSHRLRGEVVSVKWRDSDYGGAYKMVLRDERGFRVWMTVPARLIDMVDVTEDLKGATIEVTASVTPSDDDRVFGFGKQPRDAKLVALAGSALAAPQPVVPIAPQHAPGAPTTQSPQPVLPAKYTEDAAVVKAQKEQIAKDKAAEPAKDAARIAAGTPTAVSQSTLDQLGDEDEVKVSIDGADAMTMPWKTGRLVVASMSTAVVVGLGKQESIPF